MHTKTPSYHRYRFPPEIISHAVWLCYRVCLSLRDVEDLLAERGVIVSYETIRQWSRKLVEELSSVRNVQLEAISWIFCWGFPLPPPVQMEPSLPPPIGLSINRQTELSPC